MPDQKEGSFSPDQKIQFQVLSNQNLSKETIAEWVEKDIKGVYILLAEILQTREILNAIVDVYYEKYKQLHETTKPQNDDQPR